MAAVDGVIRLAGAGAISADSPLQRCFRDLHAVDAHTFVSPDIASLSARHALGLPVPPHAL